MAEAHNAGLVRRAVVEIWNQGELGVADVLFTSDYINHAGLITDLVHGPEAIKISVAFYRTAFPELQITIDELTAKRDAVLMRWTAHHSRPPAGDTTRAQPGALSGILVCRMVQNQIGESWMHWDQSGALQQLGLSPTHGHLMG